MKSVHLLPLALVLSFTGVAQTPDNASKPCETDLPLPAVAFDKMIVQDITYAIVGENTPTSGLKVDVTKPEATISGTFMPKSAFFDIFSFDFKAGASDRNISLFKGFDNFNTAFELRPSFHFIPAWSSAKYGFCEDVRPKTMIIEAKNRLLDRYEAATADSFYVSALIRERYLAPIEAVSAPVAPQPITDNRIAEQKKILLHLLKKYTKDVGLTLDEYSTITLNDMVKSLPVIELEESDSKIIANKYNDKVIQDYEKYKKANDNAKSDILTKKIKNTSEIWTKKTYYWFTLSPFGRTEKLEEYYTRYNEKDSLYIKSAYRFYYGVTAYMNHYIIYPEKKAHLFRYGISLSRNNNLTSLSSFNYENKNPFFAYGTSVTEKIKSGTAYNHNDITSGFVTQLNFEYYLLPLKSLVPGLYVSANANISNIYRLPTVVDRSNDRLQIPLEGGAIFNINSREKDKEKSILSILIYLRHEDVTDIRRTAVQTHIEESQDDFRKRNIRIGIRVGIPITLPQRSN
jgi:hypothetical protein